MYKKTLNSEKLLTSSVTTNKSDNIKCETIVDVRMLRDIEPMV